MDNQRITIRSLFVGVLFAAFFAYVTTFFESRRDSYVTANQIAVLPYVLLLVSVMLVNPLCRLVRFLRAFTVAELLTVFIMGSVSAGISTYGLADQLLPVIGSLHNRHWNNDQSEWDLYVVPFVNDAWFVSEPGVRQAALAYHQARGDLDATRQVYDRALAWQESRTELAAAQSALVKAQADGNPDQVAHAQFLLEIAQQRERAAGAAQRGVPGGPGASPEEVLRTYPERIGEEEAALAAAKKRLEALEAAAIQKVELFRRGLPADMRAYPGLVPLPGENYAIYAGRLHRLVVGRHALAPLRTAQRRLAELPEGPVSAELAALTATACRQAVAVLTPLDETPTLGTRKESLAQQSEALNRQAAEQETRAGQLRQQRRAAAAAEASTLNEQLAALATGSAELKRRQHELALAQRQLQQQLASSAAVAGTVQMLTELAAATAGPRPPTIGSLREQLAAAVARFASFDASLPRFLWGQVPWRHWLRPLTNWLLLIFLTYLVLMTFNVLIFRQWAHHERLIYPLAELPKILAGGEQLPAPAGGPALYRSGLFWAGVAVSGSVLGWNLLCYSKVIPNLAILQLDWRWAPYIQNSVFQGLLPSARCHIFFTMIGLAFLVPARISFSLWLFSLLYMLQLLVLVWCGYGQNEQSFAMEWWYTMNFRTAQGGGALLVFAAVVLYRCRRYLGCCVRPREVADLELPEQQELRLCSLLFWTGSVALVLMLWLGLGANLGWTLFLYVVVIVITIGLVRAVAEGGILGFQAWVGPFHLIRSLWGMNHSWTAPSLFTPLLAYYAVMFLDIKTFVAPTMANCLKLRDDLKLRRLWFHLAVILGIVAATTTAISVHLMMAYASGADAMNWWFYDIFPKEFFNQVRDMTKTMPVDTSHSAWWLATGAGVMTVLLLARQHLFWLPHPIGLIMLVNPIMRTYWFSVFLGWLAKALLTRYGNKQTYARTREFFVGLIVGELFIVALALIVSAKTGVNIPIDLDRN